MVVNWDKEDLEEMGLYDPFDKALFLSGCSQHELKGPNLEGYVVTEEKLLKFVELYNKFSENTENNC